MYSYIFEITEKGYVMDTNKKIKIYACTAMGLAVLITVLRTLCLFYSYDVETGYFNPSPLNTIANILIALAIIGTASARFIFQKDSLCTELSPKHPTFRLSSLCSALITLLAAGYIATVGTFGLLGKIALVFSVISTAFYTLGVVAKSKFDIHRAFLSIACIIAYIAVLASLYFNMNVAMNSPHKIYGSFALMVSMLLMLCETRIYLGVSMPRAHIAFAALTLIFGFSQSISSFIFILSGASQFAAIPVALGNLGYGLLLLAVSVYAAARCFAFKTAEVSSEIKTKEIENGM